jgi:hypothetical protein
VIRLHVVVEGRTEELFVTQTLAGHLAGHDVFATPITVTTRRDPITGTKIGKGGGHWKHWRRDIRRLFLDGSSDVRFTTVFDLYGLPSDFPKLEIHRPCADTVMRAELLEQAMAEDLQDRRLIPYLQRHEFEALVLAGLDQLRSVLDTVEDLTGLDALRADIGHTLPEEIDDGAETAPSKRLIRHVPSYQKSVHGPLVVGAVGLGRLRAACPRFDSWITRLERLSEEPSG